MAYMYWSFQLKTGAEGAKMDLMTPKMKLAMTVMPFFLFPIM